MLLVDVNGTLVSADARLPNALLAEAIQSGQVQEFSGYDSLEREVTWGSSRFDLMLAGRDGLCYIEAKSVTLVDDGVGLFPDSPTERGRKHVAELQELVQGGTRAAVAFVIQRADAVAFRPNADADPRFCAALEGALAGGVEVYAFKCEVSMTEIRIAAAVPIMLE